MLRKAEHLLYANTRMKDVLSRLHLTLIAATFCGAVACALP
jgi:hypothetical protein